MYTMRVTEKLKGRLYRLSIRERLTWSNLLMFLIPVAVTILSAIGACGIALYAFERFYLPRMGLTLKGLHDMGERYESDLKSFLLLLFALFLGMLVLLVLSIVLTNRFLTRFMFRRVEEPLHLLTDGVSRISRGEWDHPIPYDRPDEFAPVLSAFNDMAARLKEPAEQSAAEEQSRRELFAGISHDLRSPLTSVRAYTEALLDGVAKTPEDTQRYLTKIRRHEAELEHLTEALFLYTKMELKDYPVHWQTLDLRAEIGRICEENPPDAHIEIDLSGVLPFQVSADPFLLERMVLNLPDNNRKYRRGAVAHVQIFTARSDSHILLSVSDDVIGVPDALLPRLFDPFYRTDPARRDPAGGSGLGLAIVREAAVHLGGSVFAENRPGGGLRVTIALQEARNDGEHSDH